MGDETKEYSAWISIKGRCYNPRHQRFHTHGGLGVKVCEQWRTSFVTFLSDMGKRPEGMSLVRKDKCGDFTPSNCYWGKIVNDRKSPEGACWRAMIDRCHNPSSQCFKNYGGRGISVSDEWRESFYAFLSDMGPRPTDDHSLDRIDNNGNYCKENCRWTTWFVQQNNRRNSQYVTAFGYTKTIAEWARLSGLPDARIRRRLATGISPEKSIALSAKHYPAVKDRELTDDDIRLLAQKLSAN